MAPWSAFRQLWSWTRLMGGVLPGVTGADPVACGSVVAVLAASAFVASHLPARRATRLDPLVALPPD
ncbi:MAG: hypothetical protein ACRD15_12795 [Vicinamibacterales bacterium]